jgi:hypothetical protein
LLLVTSALPTADAQDKSRRAFWIQTSVAAAAMTADGVTTFAFRRTGTVTYHQPPAVTITETYPLCSRETGTPWLYGSTPSRGRMAAILAGEFTASALAGRWLQKKGKWYWRVPQSVLTGTHAAGAISNFSNCW